MQDTTTNLSHPHPADKVPRCTAAAGATSLVESQTDSIAPRLVLRGANNHTSTIDWFRIVGPHQDVGEISQKFDSIFGPHKAEKGRFGLRSGRVWPGGFYLAVDTPVTGKLVAPHAVVEISGSALAPLSHEDKLGLMAFLMSFEGWHCTRIDLARDYFGENMPFIVELADACNRGELTGARCYNYDVRYKTTLGHNKIVGEMLCIGTRGKNGSGRYVRVYDKGIQTGDKQRGEWVRWEAELSKGVAHAAAIAILTSEDPMHTAEKYAFGVCDFRVQNGKRLRDRPRCTWWQCVLKSLKPERATMPRSKPDADRYAAWLKWAVYPSVTAFADAMGMTRDQFIDRLCGRIEPNLEKLDTPAGQQLIKLFPCQKINL